MTFDHNYLSLKKDVLDCFMVLKRNFNWLEDIKLNFSNSILPNLKMLLIDNLNSKVNRIYSTKKCNKCFICNFVLETSFLNLNNTFILPLKSNCNCESKKVVYIIKCLKCNIFYIGESEGSAKNRIKQHIYSIKRFIPYQTMHSLVVAEHFRLKEHVLSEHFRFCIFNKNLDTNFRMSVETDLINLFRQFSTTINLKPNPNNLNFKQVKYLSFI